MRRPRCCGSRKRPPRPVKSRPRAPAHRAVYDYLISANFKQISIHSQRHYRQHLDLFTKDWGHFLMTSIDHRWVDLYRTKLFDAGRLNTWNEIRKVMIQVTDQFINHHPLQIPFNPWQRVKRLQVLIDEAERQNRPWPPEVIVKVLRNATPAFRRLLLVYLYTGQRGGDVVRMGGSEVEYDASERVLIFTQQKTRKKMNLPVPASLYFDPCPGRRGLRLSSRPGVPSGTPSTPQTWRTLLKNLGLERYTLHGLRSTVAATLGEEGFNETVLMAQAGWDDSRTARRYIAGFQQKLVLRGVCRGPRGTI